jgi:hypothetical protein|tara:strand:- start:128 stop:448 length:321 start_codon:yes stop_codon:yes gene_type:complete
MSKVQRVGEKLPINDRIVDMIAERMLVGAKKYGDEIQLDDPRDMVEETLEEVMDGLVYCAIKLIQIQDKCQHLNYTYIPSEPENNVSENLVCDDCNENLPMHGEIV